MGSNLSAGDRNQRLIGTLKNDVDFRVVNLSGLDLSNHDLSGIVRPDHGIFT